MATARRELATPYAGPEPWFRWRGRWFRARATAFRVLVDDEAGRPVTCRWG